MLLFNLQHEPYRKRVPTFIDRTLGIQRFDADNLYPQRAEEVKDGSYTAGPATERLAGFIAGEGFSDPYLANLVFNDKGDTGNDLLRMLSLDKSAHRGFVLQFKYNLNLKIAQIEVIDWPFSRFGIPDEDGDVFDIKVNNNWERNPYKTLNRGFNVTEYPVFNPDPEQVRAEMNHWGINEYPGQVLMWTPKRGIYPLCRFHQSFDQAQTQSESGVFDLSSVQNGFTAATLFKYPGTFKDDEEKREFERKLNLHKGAKGASSTMVIENPGNDISAGDLVETLQMRNTDKMFEGTDKRAKTAIRENFAMPMEVLGVTPDTGMFNVENIVQAFKYYNVMTGDERADIQRVFVKILKSYWQPGTIQNFSIKPKQYITEGEVQASPAAAPAPQPQPVGHV